MIKNVKYVRSKTNMVTSRESEGTDLFIDEILIPDLNKHRRSYAKFQIKDISHHLDKYELSVPRLLTILTKRGFLVGNFENKQISVGIPPGPE